MSGSRVASLTSGMSLGSWDGEIRLWKLDAKLKSFSLVGSVAALGVVNSLQFVSPSQAFFSAASWTSRSGDEEESVQPNGKHAKTGASSVLLVAGLGQEMRSGRWICKKGEGYINGALVFALHPRT